MKKKKKFQIFSMDDAKKMVRKKNGFYLFHIEWFNSDKTGYQGPNLVKDYPDCHYVLIQGRKRWRDPKAIFGVVKDKKYNGEISTWELVFGDDNE